jgi:signal transduction histidine kinase/ligand-binding sensor domain-containing protein
MTAAQAVSRLMPSWSIKMETCERLARRPLWLCAIYLLFLLPNGYALDPSRHISQYGHTLWRRQDGLVGATSPITQTSDGYIWIGIPYASGLARFDGVNFVPWTLPGDNSLAFRHLSALLGASDGSLWIGTAGGIGRLKDGQFRSYSKPADRWGTYTIIEDHTGHIWFTRYHVPHGEGTICEALDQGLHCYGPADGVPLSYGVGLAEDSQGNFWIGSRYLCRWKPGSTCTMYFNNRSASSEIDAIAAVSGPSQTVWAVAKASGREGGLQRFSGGKWSSYSVPGLSGPGVDSEAILSDRDGSLWVGTLTDGLYRIHNGVVEHYGPADGLSGHQVESLYEDHEGNLWVTTDGGMDMFRNTPVVSYSVKEGLSSSYPTAILASRDGSIWIGANDGIDVLRDGRKQDLPGWLSREQTLSLFEDHTGTIWFSSGYDLVYWDHGHFHVVELPNREPQGGSVTGITEDAEHNLWALAKACLFRIDKRHVEQCIPLPKDFVSSGLLAPDPRGGIWISDSARHLYRYSNGQFETIELKGKRGANAIEAMIADADDPLLVATLGGLFRWDGQRWTVLDARNGLPCTQLVSVVKDEHAALWLGAEHCGFLRIDPSELAKWRHDAGTKVAAKVLDRLDGAFPGQKLRGEPYATRAPDGRIWFANGFEVETVDPDHLYQNSELPPVHIETVTADDKLYEPSSALRLPARTRNLEIDYTALSLSAPQKVKFRYKLEGHDTGWQNPGTRRQAFYTDLEPGRYTFHVVASNNDGLWNENGAAMNFAVAPAFDQTAWFKALCILAVAGAVWALYWMRLRQATTRLRQRLGAQMEERERIAHELHDTFFQGIQGLLLRFHTATSQLSKDEPARRIFEETLKQSDQVMLEGRELVLDLRATAADQNDLPTAFANFGEQIRKGGSCGFRVVVNGSVRPLHPVVFEELFKIGKEALSNAFRHSGAHSIEAELNYERSQLRLQIRDDGAGIDSTILGQGYRDGHFGLPGMRERAQKVGAHLDVWSRPGAGTEIEVRIAAGLAYASEPHHSKFWKLRRLRHSKKQERGPLEKGHAPS